MEKITDLSNLGLKECSTSKTDLEVQKYFEETVYFSETEKRYMVKWPYRSELHKPGNTWDVAFKRLNSILKTKLTNSKLRKACSEIFDYQLEKGIIEKVPENLTTDNKVFYLPHHVVLRMDHITTKIRIVFDASANPFWGGGGDP